MSRSGTYEERLVTLEIGLAGCYGAMTNGGSCTMYDTRLSCYYGDLVEGGWVIRKTNLLAERPGLAVLAPLCRGNLPPGIREAFGGVQDSFVAQTIAASAENSFGDLARLMLAAPDCGAFDHVAPNVYAAWWRQHGADIGQRRGDRIVWENGDEEPIRPASERYLCA